MPPGHPPRSEQRQVRNRPRAIYVNDVRHDIEYRVRLPMHTVIHELAVRPARAHDVRQVNLKCIRAGGLRVVRRQQYGPRPDAISTRVLPQVVAGPQIGFFARPGVVHQLQARFIAREAA